MTYKGIGNQVEINILCVVLDSRGEWRNIFKVFFKKSICISNSNAEIKYNLRHTKDQNFNAKILSLRTLFFFWKTLL